MILQDKGRSVTGGDDATVFAELTTIAKVLKRRNILPEAAIREAIEIGIESAGKNDEEIKQILKDHEKNGIIAPEKRLTIKFTKEDKNEGV